MVEPTTGQIQSNAVKPGNTRPKVESERKSSTAPAETTASDTPFSDSIELTLAQTEQTDLRPEQDPIDSDEQAGEIVQFTHQQITSAPTAATFAQANLNPDRVLELIA